ncbi:MAG TPA: hypothetical protein VJ437_10490 [Acidiferrobacterales bacterium]|nr:hypothetical protein [Acidiferrobacterales bacterium]
MHRPLRTTRYARHTFTLFSLLCALGFSSLGHAGIADNYPGDVGIENDPDVIFVENFEEASINALGARWEDVVGQGLMSFSADRPAGSGGSQSVLFNGEAHLYRRLAPGYDQLYLRFYAKFDPACSNVHHFVHLGGYNPTTRWPQGGAGLRPAGNERWTTGIEPYGTEWRWDFYSYWMEMRSWQTPEGLPDGRPSPYYGNAFLRAGPEASWASIGPAVVRGEWASIEVMVKMNDPVSARNGEQTLWINGQLVNHQGQTISRLGPGFPNGSWLRDKWSPNPAGTPFEGFRWRSDAALNINFLWLLHYVDTDPSCAVRFDHVVVARNYIGPIATSADTVPPAAPTNLTVQ